MQQTQSGTLSSRSSVPFLQGFAFGAMVGVVNILLLWIVSSIVFLFFPDLIPGNSLFAGENVEAHAVLFFSLIPHLLLASVLFFLSRVVSVSQTGRVGIGLLVGLLASIVSITAIVFVRPFLPMYSIPGLFSCGGLLAGPHVVCPTYSDQASGPLFAIYWPYVIRIEAPLEIGLENLFLGWSMGWLGGLLQKHGREKRATIRWKAVCIASTLLLGLGLSMVWQARM